MRYRRFGLTAFVTFLILSVDLGLPVFNRYFSHNSQVLAQSLQARTMEADRLNKQGIQQAQTSQFEAALQSWQQALIICREIKNRQCEGAVLGNLGLAYNNLGNYAQVIEYLQQSLVISRETKDRKGEGTVLGNLGLAYHSLGDYAKAIVPLLNTQPLIGKQATKKVVTELLPRARIIHLATHGLLDDVRGIDSAIALDPNPEPLTPSLPSVTGGVNGLLTASEILSLKLNAELVVLSACDTGRGKIFGDGVVGLSRSLITAGVSSIIVSLWAVSDDSTAFLMTEFYKNIQQNPDKAQALRQAMLTTMKKKEYSKPRLWAAFTLIGESQ